MSWLTTVLFVFMCLNMLYLYTLEKKLIFSLLIVNLVSTLIFGLSYILTYNSYILNYLLLGTCLYNISFSIHYIYVLNKVRNNDNYLISKIVKFFGLQKQIDRDIAIKLQELDKKRKNNEKNNEDE